MADPTALLTLIDRYAEACSARDEAYHELAAWYYEQAAAEAAELRAAVARALDGLAVSA